ncbi:TetR/AcrR family transcriptional regulator [Nocardia sp. CA-151230]|uniref:TetR/AcrR family transcriptional regulator n=1 Tax=Nocardia sp. CA-151230 TaxID=3239982 RepID=UPI003D8E9430
MSAEQSGVVPLRERREQLTLRTILTTARRLFAEGGYTGTSVRSIAREAGVVPQTIYSHFGSKAGVLRGLIDLLEEEAGLLDLRAESENLDDAMELIELMARGSRQVRERCGDILALLHSGASIDAEIANARADAMQRNRIAIDVMIVKIRETGQHVGAHGTDVAVALMTDDVYHSLVTEAGWKPAEYEQWLTNTLALLLLESEPEVG